jgi:hypothetical protein
MDIKNISFEELIELAKMIAPKPADGYAELQDKYNALEREHARAFADYREIQESLSSKMQEIEQLRARYKGCKGASQD